MKTTDQLQALLDVSFEDGDSLIKQEDIAQIEADLNLLDSSEKKGYTIPQLDTIGMNLSSPYAYSLKGS